MNTPQRVVTTTPGDNTRALAILGTLVALPAPRAPQGLSWQRLHVAFDRPADVWLYQPAHVQVLSTIDMARQPRTGTLGPQWHVSVVDLTRRLPARPSAEQVAIARCAFDMLGAEEDNHHPGNARHFWLPVDPSERVDCECKTDEVIVRDADGYEWTNPVDGPCRGCEHEQATAAVGVVKPCPLHHAELR